MELKVKGKYHLTKAQLEVFPIMHHCGVNVWIIVDASEEEYAKLFAPGNWREYLKPADIKWIKAKYPDYQNY